MRPRTKIIIAGVLAAIIVLSILAAVIYFLTVRFPKGAVVTNGVECAQIGADILDNDGSAVDAAIAALFCEGVCMPQSMGLGGGFLMTVYRRDDGTVDTLNAREKAPQAATEDMFHGDSNLSTKGGLAVAVPMELRGYWEAYNKYGGKVPWKDLIQPTIDLCKDGILVTDFMAGIFTEKEADIRKDQGLREAFIDSTTDKIYVAGQKMKRLRLASTLEIIAKEGGEVLNNGSLTQQFVQDITAAGGIITVEDMKNAKPEWQRPVIADLPFGQTLYSSPLPGSGVILGFIMSILNGFIDYSQPDSLVNWQRIVESFKFGYGKRTELGDMNFVDIADLIANLTSAEYAEGVRHKINDHSTSQDPSYYGANTTQPDDHGTAHISILAPNGDAVAVTSTINLYFGAGFMSLSTGIILNDEMDDFSSPNMNNSFDIPPSIANYIRGGKRPLSSMCPSIIVDEDRDVRLVVGAAGGTKITTSIALIMIKNLWFNMTLEDAINDGRLHHQLFPMQVEFEKDFPEHIVKGLSAMGHDSVISEDGGFAAVTSVSKEGNTIYGNSDKRRSGDTEFVY